MLMLNEYMDEILNTCSVSDYESAIEKLIDYLLAQGKADEAAKLGDIAALRKNSFSSRAGADDLSVKKDAVLSYMKTLTDGESGKNTEEIISTVLMNFPEYCRKLYMTKIHDKCSHGVKEHLEGFHIENEYDLQKLMLPVLIAIYPDTRPESVQDSGHHAIRKDIVIDSIGTVIELKCTRPGITERQLSEEIASDMVHYEAASVFFYIYDKAGIIHNTSSFVKTYEEKDLGRKKIHVIIYAHDDI